jgi:ubiquitin-conjugating enzyme (huntingtin interacting protein 2)
MGDLGRIQKELKEIERDKASGVTVQVKDSNLQHLIGLVPGPKDTPYDGGIFTIDIVLDNQYPFVPPKMKFLTKVWHPNISSATGAICLDILKDQWSPALTLKTALLSLQALLASPQPDDPQDGVVAKEYITDIAKFRRTAKHWTDSYANPKASNEKINRLLEMGFSRDAVLVALQLAGGDENVALERLLGA